MLDGASITSILGAGAIGLGFLLAYLTYNLLKEERAKYGPIYVYEFFCFALVIVGAVLQYSSAERSDKNETLEIRINTLQAEKNTAQESLRATQTELETAKQNLNASLSEAEAARAKLKRSLDVMTGIANMIPTALAELSEINSVLTGNVCSGGSSGIPISGGLGAAAARRSTTVMNSLTAANSSIDAVLAQK